MPSKRVLLTGGSRGIGKELALQLVDQGFDVVITVRSAEAGRKVQDLLEPGKRECLSWVILHLESVGEVQRDLSEILCLHTVRPFDIVVLNAGTMFPDTANVLIEQCFQTNYLGHFMLSVALIKNRPDAHQIHFVAVGSVLLKYVSWMKPPKTKTEMAIEYGARENIPSGWKAYALSKLSLACLCMDLAEHNGVTAIMVNPGNSSTDISKKMPGWQRQVLRFLFKGSLIPVKDAASRVLYGITNPLPKNSSNWYHENRSIPLPIQAIDEKTRFVLFEFSEKMIARNIESCGQ